MIFSMPKSVALNNDLSPRARLLYGHILSLSYKTGYCWASNRWLAQEFGVVPRSIQNDISELKEAGLLHVDLSRKGELNTERKLHPLVGVENDGSPPMKDFSYPPRKEIHTPHEPGFTQGIQDEVYKMKKKAPATKSQRLTQRNVDVLTKFVGDS